MRSQDLDNSIRESYKFIRDYEFIVQTSNRPEEKMRARRTINQQWKLIGQYANERVSFGNIPSDVHEIIQVAQSKGVGLTLAKPPNEKWKCVFCGAENTERKCVDCNAPKRKSEEMKNA